MATAIAKIIQNDRRCPKNLQTDMGKEFHNRKVQKLLKKTQSLFNVFRNEGIGSRTVQSYVEKRYVETI